MILVDTYSYPTPGPLAPLFLISGMSSLGFKPKGAFLHWGGKDIVCFLISTPVATRCQPL